MMADHVGGNLAHLNARDTTLVLASRAPQADIERRPGWACKHGAPVYAADGETMAEVLVFHHAQGLTEGIRGFADELRAAGHTVHTPDLYDGRVFGDLDEGLAFVEEIGFGEIIERGGRAAGTLPAELVYAGFSLGVVPAQMLAQNRPGARGALFFHACVPASEFGSWPAGVPVQIHAMEADPFFLEEGDIDAARELAGSVEQGELFLYPGDRHLFADRSLASYDPEAAALLTRRVLEFLK